MNGKLARTLKGGLCIIMGKGNGTDELAVRQLGSREVMSLPRSVLKVIEPDMREVSLEEATQFFSDQLFWMKEKE